MTDERSSALFSGRGGSPVCFRESWKWQTLSVLFLANEGRFSQSKEHDFFAGGRADVVMQAQDFDAGRFLDHRFHHRSGQFDQLGADLLEQISSFFREKRFDQLLLGCGQHALKTDHEQIVDQVSLNILGATSHIFLLKPRDPLADRRFDFSLRLHNKLQKCPHTQFKDQRERPGVLTENVTVISAPEIFHASYQSRKKNPKLIAILNGERYKWSVEWR